MQRYHAGSCTSAVNNSTIGGPSTRDAGRSDSSSLPANFSWSLLSNQKKGRNKAAVLSQPGQKKQEILPEKGGGRGSSRFRKTVPS
ncbi:hypothetical protein JHK86_017832 [Glycine max]|nr:hypothetical protein JHK86_017832 [Glycine max]